MPENLFKLADDLNSLILYPVTISNKRKIEIIRIKIIIYLFKMTLIFLLNLLKIKKIIIIILMRIKF